MPGQTVKLLKVFIASPGDVMLEREKARDEVLSLRALAHKHGFDLEATGWETHAAPGMGRSQARINQLVRECDLFLGILWRRFGLPTGEAESGTLEEFNLARERYAKEHAPEIMLYFREVHPDFLADPGPQLHKVLEFKQQVEDGRLALYANYRDPEHFASLLRQHITDWLLKLVPDNRPGAPSAQAVEEIPPLSAFAEHLEYCRTELQKTARPLRLRTLTLPPLFLEEVEAERPRNMKVSIAVKTFPRLLILGEPGAGKTTSLKKLASEYAVWRGEGNEPGLNEPEDFNLPIFVDLSAYPTLAAKDSQHGLWRLLTASVRGVHDVDVRKRLAAGGCLLLFDGLNEVGEAYDEVVHHLRHLVHEIPHNRFVVACRPGIYREELRREFTAFQLERLSSFNASKVLEIEIGAEKAQPAWKGLDEYTRDLCRNPLMLTLLADELRASDNPPQNRAELFDRFIDRYLSEWARVKGAGSVRVEKEILSALAWRLGTSRTLLSADEAAAVMSTRLAELQSNKDAPANLNVADLNREFLHHGLLRESAGQTGFFHQAVQEYFFAREVALHQSIEYVLKHVNDPEWAEVLVFVCGLVEDATEVVRQMRTDTYLAVRCITYAKHVDPKFVDELILVLIKDLKEKFEADIWLGELHKEMFAILMLERKAFTQSLFILFYRVYELEAQAMEALTFFLLGMSLPHRAISIIEPAINENSTDAKLRGWLGWALRRAHRCDDAISHLKRGLELSAWLLGLLGVTYRRIDDLDKAEIYLRKAIELDEKDNLKWVYFELGHVLQKRLKLSEAITYFEKAIELGWKSDLPHFQIAEINRRNLNNPEKAINEYEVCLQLEHRPHGLPPIVIGLARALEAAGRTAEAQQRYQEYLDRFPWGEHAQEALAALERLGGG